MRTEEKQTSLLGLDKKWSMFLFGLIGVYGFASFVPKSSLWGFAAFAYFPIEAKLLIFIFFLALLAIQQFRRKIFSFFDTLIHGLFESGLSAKIFSVIVVAVIGFAYYSFPMKTDMFGDTRVWYKYLSDNSHPAWDWFKEILSSNIFESKEALTLNFHRYIASIFSLSIGETFCIVDVVCGIVCIGLWILLLRKYFQASKFQSILFITALLLGANQIFFGHIETYTFASIFAIIFLTVIFLFLDGKAPLWLVLILFILTAKAHIIYVLFFPGLLVAIAWRLRDRFSRLNNYLTWKWLSIYFLLPLVLIGILLYFFVFHSYDVLRTFEKRSIQRVFLPLISSPPPFDHYSLLSFNHLFDLLNVFVLIGAPALFLVFGIIFFHWKEIPWNAPHILVYSTFCIFLFLFLFAMDPQLSMVRDWDIYCLFAAPLLFFLAAVMLNWRQKKLPIMELFIITLLGGFASLGFYGINASKSILSHRLEDLGEYAFCTYYDGSGYFLDVAQAMEEYSSIQLERRIATVQKLAPFAMSPDKEYARLFQSIGDGYAVNKDYSHSILWMEQAYNLDPHSNYIVSCLSEYYRLNRNYQPALEYALKAIQIDATDLSSWKLAILASARQNHLSDVKYYLDHAAALAPCDSQIIAWTKQLQILDKNK